MAPHSRDERGGRAGHDIYLLLGAWEDRRCEEYADAMDAALVRGAQLSPEELDGRFDDPDRSLVIVTGQPSIDNKFLAALATWINPPCLLSVAVVQSDSTFQELRSVSATDVGKARLWAHCEFQATQTVLMNEAAAERQAVHALLQKAVGASFRARRLEERAKKATLRDPRASLDSGEIDDLANHLRRLLEALMADSADAFRCFELAHPRTAAKRARAE